MLPPHPRSTLLNLMKGTHRRGFFLFSSNDMIASSCGKSIKTALLNPDATYHVESHGGKLDKVVLVHIAMEQIPMGRRFDRPICVWRAYMTGVERGPIRI